MYCEVAEPQPLPRGGTPGGSLRLGRPRYEHPKRDNISPTMTAKPRNTLPVLFLRSAYLLLVFAACTFPAIAKSVTYGITFTGGYYGGPRGGTFIPDAPQSGSFSYDPATGFSNFIVDWGSLTFNLTTAANANPAMDFESLMTNEHWTALQTEGLSYAMAQTTFGMDGIGVQDPGLPSGPGTPTEAIVFQGTYALTSVPEPGSLGMLVVGVLLLCRLFMSKRRIDTIGF
jgi:hypothetical protein